MPHLPPLIMILTFLGLGMGIGIGLGFVLDLGGRRFRPALRERRPGPAAFLEGLEKAPVGVLLLQDRTLRWANPRAAAVFGADPETLQGAGTRAFHQDGAAYEGFQGVLDDINHGGTFQGDVHLRRVDGSPFWAHLTGSLLEPARPEEGILWFLEDVTERVEAQLDLTEVLSLNQKLIAASPTGIMLYQAADGACLMANEAAARIVQGTREGLLRQNFRRVPSWRASGLREAADRALATGAEQELECHFTSSFGTEVWVVAHFVPFTSRGERLLLLLADDVSERVRAHDALRASEEKYRVVVEALNEGLALLDSEGRLLFCNGRLAEMGGFMPEEVLGRHYSLFVDPGALNFLLEKQILTRPVEAETFEVGLRTRGGSILETRISVASVLDAKGVPTALAILVTDISVGKRIERERERLMGELEQKNKELETLLYVASHDLRSPLVNIQGFSQRLGKSLDEIRRHRSTAETLEDFKAAIAPHLEERMPASLKFIQASGAKMDGIINGLLTLSRAGRMVLREESLDMDAIVGSCASALAFQIQAADGALQVEPLPPCRADPVQVAQILSNLLDNAVKYRHPDRPLRVRVSGRLTGDRCEYRVEDNGVGIAPEHRDRIWEIFQRLDPQGPIQGDGLGLTLVRRMAERNGGSIRAESAPEHGCTFLLELPAGVGKVGAGGEPPQKGA